MNTLVMQNVVVVAQNLNPTIFSQIWLVRNSIFQEDDLQGPNNIFTAAAVNIDTTDLSLLVMPERLQVAMKADDMSMASKKLELIISALPHTPYRAIGFNFNWIIEPKNAATYASDVRKMFLADGNPLRSVFSDDNARFGSYLSIDKFDMRLKLDIKPSFLNNEKTIEALAVSFNYHKDAEQLDPAKTIIASLQNLQLAREFTIKMTQELEAGWTN